MVLLVGFSFVRIALGVLYVSITLIVLYILYTRLLRRMNKDVPEKALYCELNTLEKNPASGELEFYFTSNDTKHVTFEILNDDYAPIEMITDKEYAPGQHILRYDSTRLPNGNYFYQLKTDNQQTMRKMIVVN